MPLRPAPSPLVSRFVSLNIGNTLILKACGFIEAQQARILDVTEDSLTLRIGAGWLERMLREQPLHPPLELKLYIQDACADIDPGRRPHATSKVIDVTISPLSARWSAEWFQETSRRLLWQLHSHFLAC